jgi:hypothetical protein
VLERCALEHGALHVQVGERANAIRFYGAHGVLRYQELGRAEASYTPRDDDPYVRVEVIAHGAVVYTNPILRWNGEALPRPEARLRVGPTWAVRAGGAVVLIAFAWLVRRVLGRARQGGGAPELASGIRNST